MSKENTIQFDRYAIFQTGGKQYQAIEGKTIAIEKLEVKEGEKIVFDKVLLRKTSESSIEIGKPYVNAPISATVVKHLRGPKIIVFRFKRRKKYTKKRGHRQPITVVRIQSI